MLENFQIIDITPTISKHTAVYPGDIPFTRTQYLSTSNEDKLTLSSINTTLHIGAHADASNHYHKDGKSIDEQDLSPYLGQCQVVEVKLKRAKEISLNDLELSSIVEKRILFKTDSFRFLL